MKVHPVVPKRRNITLQYDTASSSPLQRKLRRLPHVFSKVLELPFHSDADVSVEETAEFFRFTVSDTDVGSDARADPVQICPGVTKIVVRSGSVPDVSMTELQLELWRFRLPESTRPELTTASCEEGDLVIVVPKGEEEEKGRENAREVWEGNTEGNLVLVQ